MSANKQFPWLGVALVVTSLFMPYVSVGFFHGSGFEIMKHIGVFIDQKSVDDFAILMLFFSPFVFALSGLISTILLLANKSPRIIGGLHLTFVIIFVICAAIAPTALGMISIFDFVGTGFYMGAFSSVLLFMRSHDPYYEMHNSTSYHDEYKPDSEWPWWIIILVPMVLFCLGLISLVLNEIL